MHVYMHAMHVYMHAC